MDTQTKEMVTLPLFIEKKIMGDEPPRCVDGRTAKDSKKGPQMLGGTSHVILLEAIYNDRDFDKETVISDIQTLNQLGIPSGGHRGAYQDQDQSDCGFSDRMPQILKVAIEERDSITKRIKQVVETNKEKLPQLHSTIDGLLTDAWEKISSWDPQRIKLKGNNLVSTIEQTGSYIENVEGDHAEKVAFVNFKPETTLDTTLLNEQGEQAFNLDISTASDQAQALGVPPSFTKPASLIFFYATEIVLVEQKGKPALQVLVNS